MFSAWDILWESYATTVLPHRLEARARNTGLDALPAIRLDW